MSNYTVIWEIEVEADSPLEAAIEARAAQIDPATTATVFEVRDEGNGALGTLIDLATGETI
jgi:hypothetical protein